MDKVKVNHKKIIIISVCVIVALFIAVIVGKVVLVNFGLIPDDDLKYTQEYIAGTGNIKGNVNIEQFVKKSPNYDIGANKYGYAVFKNPDAAFKQMKEDCRDGLKLIQTEFNLDEINMFNLSEYKAYGWQVNSGTEKEREEAFFVSNFMDIYENSFR